MAIKRRVGPALLASGAAHVAMISILLVALRSGPPPRRTAASPPDVTIARMVWLNDPGPGGGGGGGGNRMKEPPRRAEMPGTDAITVPASKPRALDTSRPVVSEQEPVTALMIPVATLASSTESLVGAIDVLPGPPTLSQGPGTSGGSGTGTGTGDGPGRGPGLGDGQFGGTGGAVYGPGNGVTMPIEVRRGTPHYTTDAMRARAQGSIIVECVVQTNGVCTDIHVTRSFDPAFGLDQEAIKAAGQWQFRPGMRRGEPVAVRVTMEILFTLR